MGLRVSHDRDAFITAYRAHTGATHHQADSILRGIELAYAAQQNAELQQALNEADGEHVKQLAAKQEAIDALQRMLENFPGHLRFGIRELDGSITEATNCADWCYACKLERLQSELAACRKQLGIIL